MSINAQENKTDGFVEDILSFDELKELEDLDELQAQRKNENNQVEPSQKQNVENLEEGELSDCSEQLPAQSQAEYLDSDHSDDEIMKQIQAKVKLSKKRRRQNNFRFVAAPAIMPYNLPIPFAYPVPVQMWPAFYPPPVQIPKKPVDLSLLDSDSDEFKETAQKPAASNSNDSLEKEEGSIDPSEKPDKKKKRSSEDNSRKSERDRDRKRERDHSSESKKRHKDRKSRDSEDRDRSSKHHKKEKKEKHKEHRSRHKD